MKSRIPVVILCVLFCMPLRAETPWESKYFNPKPAADDVILPMPCGGAMAFRKVAIPLASPIDDYAITVGQSSDELGYMEQARLAHIAGSFTVSKPEASRYYLMAKYELSQLQYKALTDTDCPKPSAGLRLPQTSVSWFDAVSLADRYNLWLRAHAVAALPKEDGIPGFVRLPTEVEWEFAARGGIAVSPAQFRDRLFPLPEGLNAYAWFAGPQSANGQIQLTGLLKPNPLGIHDILGNADEIVFEPFRINKLDRPHGQAGGYVVRGGNYLTPQAELHSAWRLESPYYDAAKHDTAKTTGFRLALVAPVLTTRARVKEIEKDWQALGAKAAARRSQTQTGDDPVSTLKSLSSNVHDDALKKQLDTLRERLRANIQARDEQRDQAIRSALQLGAFLCTKLKDDGDFLDFLAEGVERNCKGVTDKPESCERRQAKVEEHKQVVDFLVNYYADSVVEMALTYDEAAVSPQIAVVGQQLTARKKSNLRAFLDVYWKHLKEHMASGKIARQKWLESCKAI